MGITRTVTTRVHCDVCGEWVTGWEMQIIKGVAIAAVLIIAGLLALIVAAYLAFRIAAAIFEQQESWKDSGSRKGRKHDRKN